MSSSPETEESSHALTGFAAQWGFGLACFGAGVLLLDLLYSTLFRRPVVWSLAAPTRTLQHLNGMFWHNTQPRTRVTAGFQAETGYVAPRVNAAICLLVMFIAYTPDALGSRRINLLSATAPDANVWFAFAPCVWLILTKTFEFTRSLNETRFPLTVLFTAPSAAIVIALVQADDNGDGKFPIGLLSLAMAASVLFTLALLMTLTSQLSHYVLWDVVNEEENVFSHEDGTAAAQILMSAAERNNGDFYLAKLPLAYLVTTAAPIMLFAISRVDGWWTPVCDAGVATLLFLFGPVLQYGMDYYFQPAAYQTERRLFRFIRDTRPGGIDELTGRVHTRVIQSHAAIARNQALTTPSRPSTARHFVHGVQRAQEFRDARAQVSALWE